MHAEIVQLTTDDQAAKRLFVAFCNSMSKKISTELVRLNMKQNGEPFSLLKAEITDIVQLLADSGG